MEDFQHLATPFACLASIGVCTFYTPQKKLPRLQKRENQALPVEGHRLLHPPWVKYLRLRLEMPTSRWQIFVHGFGGWDSDRPARGAHVGKGELAAARNRTQLRKPVTSSPSNTLEKATSRGTADTLSIVEHWKTIWRFGRQVFSA